METDKDMDKDEGKRMEAEGKGRCIVRRLTPVECERLQGFPDGWTDIPYRGREHSPVGNRYAALGNSMAVPVMRWIGRRLERALANPITSVGEAGGIPLSEQERKEGQMRLF